MTLNDGKGLYDNIGMCDTLKTDLNNLIKSAVDGQFIQCCGIAYSMAQKLTNLKKGISDDLKSKDEMIEELKRINDELLNQKDGGTDGND